MKIVDKFFTKNIVVETTEPYLTSVKIVDRMRSFFDVSEKRNEYKTDGPYHISNIDFVVTKEVDKYTKIKMDFSLNGTENKIKISIEGSLIISIDNFGFFSETFSQFYMDKLYPETRKQCQKTIEDIKDKLDKIIESL